MRVRKNRTVSFFLIAISLVLIFGLYFFWSEAKHLPNIVYVEQGSTIELPEDIFNKFSDVQVSQEFYTEQGTYSTIIKYKYFGISRSKEIQVMVQDSMPPTLLSKTDLVFIKYGDTTDIDFSKYFVFEDHNGVSLSLNSEIDIYTVGVQSHTLKATDDFGNLTDVSFNVEIIATPDTPGLKPYYVDGVLIVNKKHPLPQNYHPNEDLEAGTQVRKLIREMQSLGYDVHDAYSGFRSYELQNTLFTNYSNRDGIEKAETYSARPGYSEHQTGLAFDILQGSSGLLIEVEPEITWIKEHAHEYGFIVRYLEGETDITGYKYEPWHLRYVGDIAESVYQSGLTLEAYLGVSGGDYFR